MFFNEKCLRTNAFVLKYFSGLEVGGPTQHIWKDFSQAGVLLSQVCYVTSAMDVTKQSISWLQVVELQIATSQREEKVKICVIGRVVTLHLKSEESHSEQINEGLGGNQAS